MTHITITFYNPMNPLIFKVQQMLVALLLGDAVVSTVYSPAPASQVINESKSDNKSMDKMTNMQIANELKKIRTTPHIIK
jgi:hypothetical protein